MHVLNHAQHFVGEFVRDYCRVMSPDEIAGTLNTPSFLSVQSMQKRKEWNKTGCRGIHNKNVKMYTSQGVGVGKPAHFFWWKYGLFWLSPKIHDQENDCILLKKY